MSLMKKAIKYNYSVITHLIGAISKRYYFEDYIRVYPDGIAYRVWGQKRKPAEDDINNFLNHQKFYKFAGQFVRDGLVADVGCGSGHGCEILKLSGAAKVYGNDISKQAINFAKKRYGDKAYFAVQGITDMKTYSNSMFDISVVSEVLEHIKEYGREQKALSEIKRITKPDGLIIICTPNTELLKNHGFSYKELNSLLQQNFSEYLIFENALAPSDSDQMRLWQKRCNDGNLGVIVSSKINLNEVASLPPEPVLKKGIDPGNFEFASRTFDTNLLHNTHSWVALALNKDVNL